MYPTHPLMHPKHLQEILKPGREEELARKGKRGLMWPESCYLIDESWSLNILIEFFTKASSSKATLQHYTPNWSLRPLCTTSQAHQLYLRSVDTLFLHKGSFCLTAGCWKWKGLHSGCLWEEGRSHQSHVRWMQGHWESHSLCLKIWQEQTVWEHCYLLYTHAHFSYN